MSVNNRNIGTLLLGAAAAYAAYKYNKMSAEEKRKMTDNVKNKFNKLKTEAEGSLGTAKTYFDNFKNKAGGVIKEHFPDAEKKFNDFFKTNTTNNSTPDSSSAPNTGF